MAKKNDEYHIVAFDPGGTTGYAHLVLNRRAFASREAKVLTNIMSWDCGEYKGTEHEVIAQCIMLLRESRYGDMPYRSPLSVVSEDFELTQLIGGNNLLIPVRINAVLGWECRRLFNTDLILQARQLRTAVTRDRLKLWKLWKPMGKDAFAAMQHAVTWVRRMKIQYRRLN